MTDKKNELITQNINLARYMAGKYKNLPMEPEELLSQSYLSRVLRDACKKLRG